MTLIVALSFANMTASATLNLGFQERVVKGIKVAKNAVRDVRSPLPVSHTESLLVWHLCSHNTEHPCKLLIGISMTVKAMSSPSHLFALATTLYDERPYLRASNKLLIVTRCWETWLFFQLTFQYTIIRFRI
jgi:hypothetical protein